MNFYGLQIEAIGVVVDGIKDQLESLELLAEEAEEDDLAVEFKAARKKPSRVASPAKRDRCGMNPPQSYEE